MRETLGIYVHIPFCRTKCDYCDFYSMAGQEHQMDDYQRALLTQMEQSAGQARQYQISTIYIGGGTPSWYGDKRLAEILLLLRKKFHWGRNVEVTVEVNPDSAEEKGLRRLRRAGVNRLSLGMQSAQDTELAAVGRPHTFAQVKQAVQMARRVGITNLSLDLIFGLPGQTLESWQDTVEQALALHPEHLSCYGLMVEEDTPLALRVEQGLSLPDDDQQAELYLWTVRRLREEGYRQYEVSNFARPNCQSRHNLRYWMGRPYLGFGVAAHSDFDGCRFATVRNLEDYLKGGKTPLAQWEQIPIRERGAEYLMLRLRTTVGIEEWEYRRRFCLNFEPIEARLVDYEQRGWAVKSRRRWRLTPEGFLLSNQLIGELLLIQEQTAQTKE